jgi:hypothetical protein
LALSSRKGLLSRHSIIRNIGHDARVTVEIDQNPVAGISQCFMTLPQSLNR